MSQHPTLQADLAVIGSGGGAFAAAIRASTGGHRVVMVERGTVGGTCVNTGCVPSKALLAAAGARHTAVDGARYPGITTSAGPVDMPALLAGKASLVEGLRTAKYLDLIDDYGWDLLRGDATFTGTPQDPLLAVTLPDGAHQRVRATHYLVATGSAPVVPDIEGLDRVRYLTSTTAMELDEVPESLLVIGGGYVAMEQAQLFARLGTQVTLVVRSRLASHEEPEVSRTLVRAFADEGIRVLLRATVSSVAVDPRSGRVVATVERPRGREEIRASHLLVAVGRRPVTDGPGLSAIGVDTGVRGEIVVDARMATSNPRVWAAGDVTGHPQFVYAASAQGALAVENAFDHSDREIDYRHLPRVVFTSPAMAAVGMTEEQAEQAGINCDCRVLSLEHVPRALVNRDTRGFVKIAAEAQTGRVIGITMVAEDAGEVAAAGVYVLAAGLTVDQLAELWSPYLTMAEGLRIAAQSFRTDVSRLSCCAS